MALGIDNITGQRASGGTITQSHATTGSDMVMYVLASCQDSNHANYGADSVTYNGVSLTRIRQDEAVGNVYTEIWRLIAPATGTHDLVAEFNATIGECSVAVITLSGADQTSPDDATNGATGNSSSASRSITTVASNTIILSVICHEDGTETVNLGTEFQELRSQSYENTSHNYYGLVASPGAQTITWTLGSAQAWALSLVSVKPAAAGTTTSSSSSSSSSSTVSTSSSSSTKSTSSSSSSSTKSTSSSSSSNTNLTTSSSSSSSTLSTSSSTSSSSSSSLSTSSTSNSDTTTSTSTSSSSSSTIYNRPHGFIEHQYTITQQRTVVSPRIRIGNSPKIVAKNN